MDRAETLAIMSVLKAAYPAYYRNMARKDAEEVVKLWEAAFSYFPYGLVSAAVTSLIAADEKGFPPHIGAVMSKMRLLTQDRGMTEQEAWAIVARAVRGASMGAETRIFCDGVLDTRTSAERKFEMLPALMQRLVGSPDQIAQWAMLPEDELHTVVASNFQRSYRAAYAAEQDIARLPEDVKRMVAVLPDGQQKRLM